MFLPINGYLQCRSFDEKYFHDLFIDLNFSLKLFFFFILDVAKWVKIPSRLTARKGT